MERSRTKKGQFKAVRYDTKVGSVEKKYGVDLGVRSDTKIGNFLKDRGYKSLSQMLKGKRSA